LEKRAEAIQQQPKNIRNNSVCCRRTTSKKRNEREGAGIGWERV
jgi:hypothetical protein